METKPFFLSRLFWVGLATLVGGLGEMLGAFGGAVEGAETLAAVDWTAVGMAAAGFLTIVLRFRTHQGVTLK